MRDNDEGLTQLVAQVEEEPVQFLFVLAVETARGLVGQNHFGLVDECACHGDALFLSSREFSGLVRGPVGQAHDAEQFVGPLFGLGGRGGSDVGRDEDVFQGGELGKQLVKLKDESDVPASECGQFFFFQQAQFGVVVAYASAVRPVEGAHDLQERGFPGSAWPDDADDFSVVDFQIDSFEHLQGAKTFGDSFQSDHGG